MKSRKKRPQRTAGSGPPSLREHLVSRRNMLTYFGASLVTGSALVGCFIGGDDDSGPGYYTMRLPLEGTDLALLVGGGQCEYFVNVMAECDYGYYQLINDEEQALALCRAAVAERDHYTLSAINNGLDDAALGQLESQLVQDLGALACDGTWSNWGQLQVALTIVTLTA